MNILEILKKDYRKVFNRVVELRKDFPCKVWKDIPIMELEFFNQAIVWVRTPEGSNFWGLIDVGEFDSAKNLQPHLFEWIPKSGEDYYFTVKSGEVKKSVRPPSNGTDDSVYAAMKVFPTKEEALASMQPKELWRAKKGGYYWSSNIVLSDTFQRLIEENDEHDQKYFDAGDYYETEELALASLHPADKPEESLKGTQGHIEPKTNITNVPPEEWLTTRKYAKEERETFDMLHRDKRQHTYRDVTTFKNYKPPKTVAPEKRPASSLFIDTCPNTGVLARYR